MRFLTLGLFLIFLAAACAPGVEPVVVTRPPEWTAVPTNSPTEILRTPTPIETATSTSGNAQNALSPSLLLADYPPSDRPHYIESEDFWLVHVVEGQLAAFVPLSPEYVEGITTDECRFVWNEPNGRFIDPCSGDEWELDGRLDLQNSSELWSNRDLDQHRVMVRDGVIRVETDYFIPGMSLDETPLAVDAHNGVTVTAVLSDFSATNTSIDFRVQVAPIWGMNPSAFPPQQPLTYVTFPDSLFDDQGGAIAPLMRDGGPALFDPQTGGLKQVMHHEWEGAAPDVETVTATLTVDLTALHRQITLPIDWDGRQEGDSWAEDIPLEIGYVAVRVRQAEWLSTTEDGLARLRLTVTDESPGDIRLYCLHLDVDDPWQRTCGNFEGELTYVVVVQPGQPVDLHLRAGVELLIPYQFVLEIENSSAADE